MKPLKIFAFITTALVIGCGQSETKEPEFFGSNFSISSCLQYAGDERSLRTFLKEKMKVNELSPEMAKHFLVDKKGKAWSFKSPDGSYAVAFREDGVCTVFIEQMNAGKYIKHMNRNIERISNSRNWLFSTNNIPDFVGRNSLESYELTVKIPGKKEIKIIISATNKTTGNYQVAFSTSLL